jgi:hypothetical protein
MGTISGANESQASFSVDGRFQTTKKKTKLIGSVVYEDPGVPLSFRSTKVTVLTFNGNQAHLAGTGKIGKKKVSFTCDVTDNGDPGTNNDFFSIQFSNGYSASGYLTSGNISIH